MNTSFDWTSVSNATAYYIYVGSTPGAKDVVDSGELQATTFTPQTLDYSQTYYATTCTLVSGSWIRISSSFTTEPEPTLVVGAITIFDGTTFSWAPVPNAQAYRLEVGTTPQGSDIADSGSIQTTSYAPPFLPPNTTVYTTLLTEISGQWYSNFRAFNSSIAVSPNVAMTFPQDGSTNVSINGPLRWSYANNQDVYRIIVGTAPGLADLLDSGATDIPAYFAYGLPTGPLLYGQLLTLNGTTWELTQAFSFTVASNGVTNSAQVQSALWATNFIREMASPTNVAVPGTLLASVLDLRQQATCLDYSRALYYALAEMNVTNGFRRLNIAFDPKNDFDTHALLEFYDSDQGTWMLLDPTFDLTVRKASDSTWASAEDMMNATRATQWNAVTYDFLGSYGSSLANTYYLDYPLLYLNIEPPGGVFDTVDAPSILPFLTELQLPEQVAGVYLLRDTANSSAQFTDGTFDYSMDCTGVDNCSYIFSAAAVIPIASPTSFQIYSVNRYVF